MTTAVDTSVLIDILIDDPVFAARSASALRSARREGRLIVCEAVIAELRPVLENDATLIEMMGDLGLDFVPASIECALRAGTIYSQYLLNKGTAKHVLPDFLIGAHALLLAEALLARDRGYYREYYRELKLIEPE